MNPTWSDKDIAAEFQTWGSVPTSLFLVHDICIGPVAIQDGSQGLTVKYWELFYEPDVEKVYLRDTSTGDVTQIFTPPDSIRSLALAFDQNGNIVISFCLNSGQLYVRRFDANSASYILVQLTTQTTSVVSVLDQNYLNNLGTSDVLIHYIRNGGIFTRVQRENYLIEHATPVTEKALELTKVGITEGFRHQITYLFEVPCVERNYLVAGIQPISITENSLKGTLALKATTVTDTKNYYDGSDTFPEAIKSALGIQSVILRKVLIKDELNESLSGTLGIHTCVLDTVLIEEVWDEELSGTLGIYSVEQVEAKVGYSDDEHKLSGTLGIHSVQITEG